ncbi:MAG: thiamine pyrophosphate-dependent enzyme [Chloroflexota bacterium]
MDSQVAVKLLHDQLTDELVISSLGTPSHLLHHAGHRPYNFYMRSAMGLASCVGLGLAIARPDRRVVILDGDGAALMNLSSMVTVGWKAPKNLTWLVLENQLFLETGGQTIAAGRTTDIAGVGRSCGLTATAAHDEEDLTSAIQKALTEPGPNLIVARVGPDSVRSPIPADAVRIKHAFMDALGTS